MGVKGVDKVQAAMKKKQEQLGRRCRNGMVKVMAHLLRDSQEIVPWDTGELYRTGRTRVYSGEGFDAVVITSYGTDYGVYVHEDPDKAHGQAFNIKHAAEIAAGTEKARQPQEQYKFLTDPIRWFWGDYARIMLDEMKVPY